MNSQLYQQSAVSNLWLAIVISLNISSDTFINEIMRNFTWPVATLPLPILTVFFGFTIAKDLQPGEAFVHVRFTSEMGQPIRSIQEEEIEVLVGGRPAIISRLMAPDEPFNIGLLMDVSPSKESSTDEIRQATADFISFFPLENPIMLLTFDSEIYLDCDWTTDRKKVDEAIWEFGLQKPGNKTILYEAIVAALQQKFVSRKPRTAMVLFSDGVDRGSDGVEDKDSISVLKESRVLTYCIQHFSHGFHRAVHTSPRSPNDIGSMPPRSGTKIGSIMIGGNERGHEEYKVQSMFNSAVSYLRQVAQAGGGLHLQLGFVAELGNAYAEIARELTDVYTVVFVPPDSMSKDFSKVRVSVSREGIVAHVRPEGLWQESLAIASEE